MKSSGFLAQNYLLIYSCDVNHNNIRINAVIMKSVKNNRVKIVKVDTEHLSFVLLVQHPNKESITPKHPQIRVYKRTYD